MAEACAIGKQSSPFFSLGAYLMLICYSQKLEKGVSYKIMGPYRMICENDVHKEGHIDSPQFLKGFVHTVTLSVCAEKKKKTKEKAYSLR